MSLSDGQIVQRTLSGDDSAFDELVSRHRARAYRLALSRVRNRDAALDIAQDAFVSAYVSLRALREPDKFAAWLASITANLCRMHSRDFRETPVPQETLEAQLDSNAQSGSDGLDAMLAHQVIDSLPDGTRSAAILFFIEEMEQSEIAEFLGIAVSAVKSRIRDARRRLQKEMIEMVKQTAKQDEPGDEFNEGLKRKLELARWYREFSDLIDAHVNVMRTLGTLMERDYSQPVLAATRRMSELVGSGSTIFEALKQCPELAAPGAISLIHIGETEGRIDVTARSLADCLEAQAVVKDVELSYWCRTLGTMLVSGVGILSALGSAAEVAHSSGLKQATLQMIDTINAHKSLRHAIAGHEDVIPPFVQAAVLAGECSGTLDQALLWVGNELAASVCKRLSAPEFHVPWKSEDELRGTIAQELSRLLADESASVRAGAASALGMLKAEVEGERVARMLKDDDTSVQLAAIGTMVDLHLREHSAELIGCLRDNDPSIRIAALQAIEAMGILEAALDVAETVADSDERVSHAATAVLELLEGVETTRQKALGMLSDANWVNRFKGAAYLRAHPTPSASDTLVRALGDECEDVVYYAAMALANLGRREALPKLIAFLDSPDTDTAGKSAKALVALGDPSAAPHIRQAIEQGKLSPVCTWMAEKLESAG